MANENLPVTKEHPEKDDPTKFGEMILNSKMWCAFCLTTEGPYVLKNTNNNDAFLLIAQFLIDNREVRETMFSYVKEKTKFEINSGIHGSGGIHGK